jgi:hypothetical protein
MVEVRALSTLKAVLGLLIIGILFITAKRMGFGTFVKDSGPDKVLERDVFLFEFFSFQWACAWKRLELANYEGRQHIARANEQSNSQHLLQTACSVFHTSGSFAFLLKHGNSFANSSSVSLFTRAVYSLNIALNLTLRPSSGCSRESFAKINFFKDSYLKDSTMQNGALHLQRLPRIPLDISSGWLPDVLAAPLSEPLVGLFPELLMEPLLPLF